MDNPSAQNPIDAPRPPAGESGSGQDAQTGRRGCLTVAAGLVLVAVGIPMLVCPGPGVATIAAGLGMIAVGLGIKRREGGP